MVCCILRSASIQLPLSCRETELSSDVAQQCPARECCTRTSLKQYETTLNTKGISFPVKLKDISKFKALNPSLPGINVLSVNENNMQVLSSQNGAEKSTENYRFIPLRRGRKISLFTNQSLFTSF